MGNTCEVKKVIKKIKLKEKEFSAALTELAEMHIKNLQQELKYAMNYSFAGDYMIVLRIFNVPAKLELNIKNKADTIMLSFDNSGYRPSVIIYTIEETKEYYPEMHNKRSI